MHKIVHLLYTLVKYIFLYFAISILDILFSEMTLNGHQQWCLLVQAMSTLHCLAHMTTKSPTVCLQWIKRWSVYKVCV